MSEMCQKVLDGFGMPAEWALSIVVPMFKGKDDIWNCGCHGAVNLFVRGKKGGGKGVRKSFLSSDR